MTRSKLHVKKDDIVKIIAGDSKGHEGKIISVNRATETVLVEGSRTYKKAIKPTQENTTGGWEDKLRAIHVSNVKLVAADKKEAPATSKAAKKSTKKAAAKKAPAKKAAKKAAAE